jgi:hypothetical protein
MGDLSMKKMLVFKRETGATCVEETHYNWYPDNKATELLCKLAEVEYFTNEQIKILITLGFKIYVTRPCSK